MTDPRHYHRRRCQPVSLSVSQSTRHFSGPSVRFHHGHPSLLPACLIPYCSLPPSRPGISSSRNKNDLQLLLPSFLPSHASRTSQLPRANPVPGPSRRPHNCAAAFPSPSSRKISFATPTSYSGEEVCRAQLDAWSRRRAAGWRPTYVLYVSWIARLGKVAYRV